MVNVIVPLLITLLLGAYVILTVCAQFLRQDNKPGIPYVCQTVCDDLDFGLNETRNAVMEKETRDSELEKQRQEYREWVENCNRLFRNKDRAA